MIDVSLLGKATHNFIITDRTDLLNILEHEGLEALKKKLQNDLDYSKKALTYLNE